MKRFSFLLILLLALTLSACAFLPNSENLLTREDAIAIALNSAGLDKSAVRDLEAELDREFGKALWEVDFDFGGKEYSFVLDAQTGEILHQKTGLD
jgi:uncharacterized membrane protein YkoI